MLHAPGSLCTYEPQWGSDVFGMFQSLVEGREVPWSLLVKDMPDDKHQDLDFIVGQLDWEKNVDTHFKEHNYLEPIVDKERSGKGYTDRWIVYGTVDGEQLFSSKELTLEPGASARCKIPARAAGSRCKAAAAWASSISQTPAMIRFGAGDRGRSVHHARSGDARRRNRKHRQRAARRPALLRSRRARQSAEDRRLSK